MLNDAIDQGEHVLLKALKDLLDIDQDERIHLITSSNPAGGVTVGAGVGASKIDRVVGVAKAYTSRVGDGPFPTELLDKPATSSGMPGMNLGPLPAGQGESVGLTR